MRRLDGELRRLADVIATGGRDLSRLTAAVRERERERLRLQARVAELATRSQLARLDRARLNKDLRERLTDWQGLIQQQPQQARQGLRKLLEGRLVFAPTADGTAVEFTGQGCLNPGWQA
jgi:chromosome segregation ATPase